MIWLYIITGLLFLGIIGFVVLWYFKKHISTLGGLCVGAIIAAVAVLICIGTTQISSNNEANLDRYNELILYQDVVSNSKDEMLRWDYYQKVQEWNDKYEEYLVGRNSIWSSVFYGAHDYDNCDYIMFELRRS